MTAPEQLRWTLAAKGLAEHGVTAQLIRLDGAVESAVRLGVADAVARLLARKLADPLGQQVIVENKAGAEGMIGSLDVMKSAPDGYRVLFGGAGSMIVVPALRRTPPFDPGTQFTPISGVVDFSFFLYAHPELPVKNLKEFVDYAHAHPGKTTRTCPAPSGPAS